jgi:4-amino-4-deoxy-L-arabinose transferase-like glycosyltransferase
MGYNVLVSGLSGLLVLVNSELIHNAHFAHNDTFVTFFSTLTILLLVQYKTKGQRGWLYATFYCAGLAISSKYSAMSLAALPFLVFFWMTRKSISKRPHLFRLCHRNSQSADLDGVLHEAADSCLVVQLKLWGIA